MRRPCKPGPLGRACSTCQPRLRQRRPVSSRPVEHGGGSGTDPTIIEEAGWPRPPEAAGWLRTP